MLYYIYIYTACIRFMKGVTRLFRWSRAAIASSKEKKMKTKQSNMVFFCHDWLEFTLNHIQHVDFTNK